jgi:hypothetical protein
VAELTAADVENFTNGRLADDGGAGEVTRMLNAALVVARRRCGWHVSPVATGDVLTVDGPPRSYSYGYGGCDIARRRELFLPTGNIVTLTSIVEDGVTLNLSNVVVPSDAPWKIVRTVGRWTDTYGGIVITLNHGYTEAQAVDWRQAILTMVDNMSTLPVNAVTGRSDADLTVKRVDDVEYQWPRNQGSQPNSSPADDRLALAEQVMFSVEAILETYETRMVKPVFFA